jgi:hypothetical protein
LPGGQTGSETQLATNRKAEAPPASVRWLREPSFPAPFLLSVIRKRSFLSFPPEAGPGRHHPRRRRDFSPIICDPGYRDEVRTEIFSASAEAPLRQRFCRGPGCDALFFVCSRCDRGQRYCSPSVCCGMELDPKYVDVVVQRWQTLSGKKAKLDDDGRTFEVIAEERRKAEV